MNLFSPDAPWKQAASHINVFKIYPNWIKSASDADLKVQFADLRRRGISLALEHGPLTYSTDCAKGIATEGAGADLLLPAVRRINQDGGLLKYVVMDEPVFFSTMKGKCHWEPERTAADAAVAIKAVLKEFPNIEFGEVEPSAAPAQDEKSNQQALEIYQRFIRAYKKEMGFPLAFFQADVVWDPPSFPSSLIAIKEMIGREGIPFGIIYDGTGRDQSDKNWIDSARLHMQEVEQSIGTPNAVIFQSWNAYPAKLFPETDSDSFTWLVDQYFRTRTKVDLSIGSQTVSGQLTDQNGQGIGGAQVTVTASPQSANDRSVEQVFTHDGTIPAGTRRAVFFLGVNTECNCTGTADFQVKEFSFQTSHSSPVRYGFSSPNDLSKWPPLAAFGRVHGLTLLNGGGQVEIANNALRVVAQPTQKVLVNGTPFSVNGGGDYHFAVRTLISRASLGSASFLLVFLGDSKEISRVVVPITQISVPIGTAATNPSGEWTLSLPPEFQSGFNLRSIYQGDSSMWPATAIQAER